MKINIPNLFSSLLLFALAVILIVWRAPQLFVHPRFWAEDGAVYFAYAYHNAVIKSLIHPQLGYYSLIVNLTSVLAAKLIPLSRAPLFTTLVALVIQSLPVLIVAFGNAKIWDKIWKKIVVISIIIFARPSAEIWLVLVSAQFHLGLATVLVLIEANGKAPRLKTILMRIILIVAGLTGVVSAILAPVFMLKYYFSKYKEDLIRSSILFAAFIVQLAAFYYLKMEKLSDSRSIIFDWREFALIVINKNDLCLFWKEEYAWAFAELIRCVYPGNLMLVRIVIISFALLALCATFIIYRISEDKILFWLLALSLTVIGLFSYVMALGDKILMAYSPIFGGRYFYAQNVIILLIMFAAVSLGNYKNDVLAKVIISVALLAAIGFGFKEFHSSCLLRQEVPDWNYEVEKWQSDHDHKLAIWPKGWTISL